MLFFDLHCHPGLKTLFQLQNGSQVSAWSNLSPHDKLLGDILESQSSLKMLTQRANINLVCITLHPPEIGMIDQVLIGLASLLAYPAILNGKRLDQMISQECPYQETFYQELENLSAKPRDEDQIANGTQIKFLTSWKDYNQADINTLHVVFNVEGGHTFYDQKNRVRDMNAVLANFDAFLSNKFKVLYFTPTHLTPNEFITHAYGNKLLSKGNMLPKGIGITPYGKSFLDHIYKNNILIDIKHMSLVSRRIFYQFRRKYYPDMPIIASHMGFVGNYWKFFSEDVKLPKKKSYGYKVKWLVGKGVLGDCAFYPLSINLYNEDIREILASKGLIGLSLDLRILGGKEQVGTEVKDFYSHEEYQLLTNIDPEQRINELFEAMEKNQIDNGDTTINLLNPEPQEMEDIQAARTEMEEMLVSTPQLEKRENYRHHIRLVLNHVLYLYKFTKDEGLPAPWDNICIGSDFDGLIEAVHCCKNSTDFADFAAGLKSELTLIEPDFECPLGLGVNDIIDKIMYRNAFAFLNRHFRNDLE